MRPAPYGAELAEAEGTLYRVTPRDEAAPRADLFIYQTRAPTVAPALLGGERFVSARHTAHDERFAYLQVRLPESARGNEVAARSVFEDALTAALAAADLGATLGAGMGARFAYVDFALRRPDEALPLAQRALRDAGAPKEAWIRFFDGTLAEEWVPVWPDSPAAPGPTQDA
jgi:hypothetical protein